MKVLHGVREFQARPGRDNAWMLYKFKSKAAGDVIMLGPNGDELLRLLGREPSATGIIEPAQMGESIARIEAALRDEAAAAGAAAPDADDGAAREKRRVALRQRLWPMREMLARALAANQPIVWGV